MEGRSVLVTGANTGIGRATATELARRGASVVIACRSEAKARPVVEDIIATTGNEAVSFQQLDLADLRAVRKAAAEVLASGQPIDVLINNAGVAGQRGLTKDGFELTFGVNHLGHFLFTTLLLPKLLESPTRIVTVSSGNHLQAKGIVWERLRQSTKTITGLREYNVSKLCNVLFTQQLVARYGEQGISAFAVNPGPVDSDVWRRMPGPMLAAYKVIHKMKTNEDGAKPTLLAATEPGLESQSGSYWNDDCTRTEVNPLATPALGGELWSRSQAWVDAVT